MLSSASASSSSSRPSSPTIIERTKTMPSVKGATNSYSSRMGFVFVFNLIMGAGALTIPRAFSHVGVLLAVLALCLLAMASFVSATFMVIIIIIIVTTNRHNFSCSFVLDA